jgi:hypothetical protein
MKSAALALALVASGCVAAPARVTSRSELQANVTHAFKSAKSYVHETSGGMGQQPSVTTFVAPNRTKTVFPGRTPDVMIGDKLYRGVLRTDAPPPREDQSSSDGHIEMWMWDPGPGDVFRVLPDVSVDGSTYGAYERVLALGKTKLIFTCTYDKQTYLVTRCVSPKFTETYSHYNDPHNIVEAPKEVK